MGPRAGLSYFRAWCWPSCTYSRLHIHCKSCTVCPKKSKQSTGGLTSHCNFTRILASPKFVRRRYSGRRCLYYSNAVATTQFLLLRRPGYVELSPGPQKTGESASKSICSFCEKCRREIKMASSARPARGAFMSSVRE